MKLRKIFAFIKSYKYKLYFNSYGSMSYIDRPLYIDKNNGFISTGNKLRIQPGLRMEITSCEGEIEIGDNVSIGQNVHITSGGKLKIGSNSTILGNVFITNIDHDYKEIGVPILDQKHFIHETFIGDNCFIGYGVAIQAGTKLGKQCIVGTNSVVRGEFPDYCVIVGVPAKVIKKYNFKTNCWERV